MPDPTKFPQKPISQLLGSNGPVHAVSYSASPGTYILTGSSDRTIRLYKPSSPSPSPPTTTNTPSSSSPPAAAGSPIPPAKLLQTYSAHGYEVLSLSVASSNAHFASAGGDRTVYLWDVTTANTLRRFGGSSSFGHTGRVNCVTFAGHDDSVLASGGTDTTVRLWDLRGTSPKPIQILSDAKDSVTSVVVADAEIIVGSVDGRVRSYDLRMGRCTADVLPASVTSLCLSRDGKTLLVGALDSTLRLFDRRDGTCLRTYADKGWRNDEFRVQSVLGGKEKFVVAGDEMSSTQAQEEGGLTTRKPLEGRVWAWDLLTGNLVAKVAVPWGPAGTEGMKKVIGKDGKEKERKNVVSCVAWQDGGFGSQFCAGGMSGVVTVFGEG
ncbi:WD40-repeat-containing domain protein [Echria macrotheca]|uniref:WD40-repeat-containing domain protein n=1 Tax=Echria macrotheca TaxID=438768 RepID=A0AAJ0BMI8_9PEZI|nr:WD40-repeat-containing domain protein [Echria macrotheca]